MTGGEPPTRNAPVVNFISDVPADEDFFDTHTGLARAIVAAIRGNAEIKVIGLLGRWGSGKSTVAKKIVEFLEPPAETGFRVFIYDAWLHQSDPLRRSFLESLIQYLLAEDAIAKKKWDAKLKELSEPIEDTRTIETPSLSTYGRWLSLSLLAVPVGIGLLDLDTFKEAFRANTELGWWTLTAAIVLIFMPLLTWLALYLWRRPWTSLWQHDEDGERPAFWRIVDDDGHPVSALALFVNGHAKRTDTRTFRSVEPTSLEFGRTFQALMEAVSARKNRLVILIDNLDRIAEDEALRMWATIRSFFLASHETEEAQHEPYHPTVILPIDRYAIEELFAGERDQAGRDRAKSFMDKTFDVTFEVTEPVSSDWRAYLNRQMATVFGDAYQVQWGFWTRRLFEAQLARQQASAVPEMRKHTVVTPREINKILNRIGALYLQWQGEGISVEVMALFVIRRSDIDAGLLAFLQSDDVDISPVAADWPLQIAALYYGVKLAKAAQVTLEQPIRRAIAKRDEARFSTISTIPGFREIFDFVTADLPDPESGNGPFDVITSAVILLASLNGQGQEWEISSWRNLINAFITIEAPIVANHSAMAAIDLLAKHAEQDTKAPFLAAATARLSELLSAPQQNEKIEGEVRGAAEALIAFATAHALAAPVFRLTGEPAEFLARFGSLTATPELWCQIRTAHEAAELEEAIDAMIVQRAHQRVVPGVVRALHLPAGEKVYGGDKAIDFETIADTANQLARQPQNYDAEPSPGVAALAELANGKEAIRKQLVALVDEGVISTRLAEAVNASQWSSAALYLAILLWRGGKFEEPSDMRWSQYESRDPEYRDRILTALARYFPRSIVRILWGSQRINGYTTRSFVEELIGYAVATDRLGSFDAAAVFKELSAYRYAVPYRLRDRFLEQVEKQRNFLDALEETPLGPQIIEAAKYLKRKGGADAARADAIVRQRVESADKTAWEEGLISGNEPYSLGLSFAKSGSLRLSQKSGLFDALQSNIAIIAKSGGSDVRSRWFALADLLKPKPRKLLFRALGEALGQGGAAHDLHVLKAGGVQFLTACAFAKNADRSLKQLVLPLLQRKDGRDWLKDNIEETGHWVSRASVDVRNEVTQLLKKLRQSKLEERRYSADLLLNHWGLST